MLQSVRWSMLRPVRRTTLRLRVQLLTYVYCSDAVVGIHPQDDRLRSSCRTGWSPRRARGHQLLVCRRSGGLLFVHKGLSLSLVTLLWFPRRASVRVCVLSGKCITETGQDWQRAPCRTWRFDTVSLVCLFGLLLRAFICSSGRRCKVLAARLL